MSEGDLYKSLSVVIPAYNEEGDIVHTLHAIHEYLQGRFEYAEVLVVDDGSTDSTAERVRDLAVRLERVRLLSYMQNRGKGHAVRTGVLATTSDLVLISDADLSTPITEITKLLAALESGYDIAIGSRALAGADVALRQPWYREYMGKTFNLFVRALVIVGFRDTQCGFKLLKGEAARRVFTRTTLEGFSFDVEALMVAQTLGYSILEVPVRWLNSPDSRVRIFRDSAQMLLDLLRVRLRVMRGLY